MIPFDAALGDALRKLGLAEPAVMLELSRDWADLAGEPWASQARPLYVKGRVLVIEANVPSGVAFLRYGAAELERRLGDRFGPDTVSSVEIRPPSRRSGGPR
ncbi:hypothetical protein BH23ACT5_BH23ACT5_07000 [soil metagenome]